MNDSFELMERFGTELNSGKTLEDSLNGVFGIVGETIFYDRIAVYVRESNGQYTCLAQDGDLIINPELSMAGVSCCVDYKYNISAEFNVEGLAPEVGSGLYVPIPFDERIVGALEIFHRNENMYNSHDERYLRNVCRLLGSQLQTYQWQEIGKHHSLERHDLKTPLTIVQGAVALIYDMLNSNNIPELSQFKKIVGVANRGCQRLNDMQSSEASLTQVEDSTGLVRRPKEVGILVAGLAEAYDPLVKDQGKYFNVENGSNGTQVLIDNGWVLRAIGNVLDNAMKYTPIGGTITLQSSSKDGRAYIGVHNTGSYIPSNEYSQILEMGETIPRETSKEGTGKGLAVCQAVALGHGGKFSMYSSKIDGTKFCLELPSIS
ncbi:MAG: hypothetical protein CMI53_01635 [Parcubacteria group bacterium]|nr:hypothetical protein [Parcubacteria group bacterium]|tara:strand:+ start:1812 stop:2939 length:1128 start_codon:yes stop_codon:yes gene_type:complete